MPNKREHGIAGAISGGVISLLIDTTRQMKRIEEGTQLKWDSGRTFLWLLGGVCLGHFAGRLPDIIEPAHNPQHRKFFHSIVFSLMGAHLWRKLMKRKDVPQELKDIVSILAASYGSHLFLDSQTPMGLPLI